MAGGSRGHAPIDNAGRFRIALLCPVRLYRDAFRAALERTDDLVLVDSGMDPDALIREGCAADALLLDIAGGLDREAVRPLVAAMAPRPVIGFGVESLDAAVDCVEAGLAGFVPAEGSIGDLVTALRAALEGRLVCSPEAARCMAERLAARALDRARQEPAPEDARGRSAPALTGREREIASLVGEGWSNKEIAKALAISPATVKNHVHIILDKLNVERRARVAPRLRAIGQDG